MGRFLKKVLLYGVICCVVANLIAVGILGMVRRSDKCKPAWLYNRQPVEKLDYIGLGSSLMETGININHVDSLYGIRGLNLGISACHYENARMMLEMFFDRGFETEMCILAIGPDVNQEATATGFEFCFLPFIDKPYIYRFMAERDMFLYLSHWFPLLGTAYYNSQMTYWALTTLKPQKVGVDKRGFVPIPVDKSNYNGRAVVDTVELRPSNRAFLEIERICQEKGVRFISYVPPFGTVHYVLPEESWRGREVINLSNLFVGREQYMYDDTHPMSEGAALIGEALFDAIRNI